jgi:hypothetical protein
MTLRRTLTVAAACSAVFGASFATGQAILDDADDTQERASRSAPPVDSGPPSDGSRLELALGRAAGLPGLRTPPQPAKESPVSAPAPAAPPDSAPQRVLPTASGPSALGRARGAPRHRPASPGPARPVQADGKFTANEVPSGPARSADNLPPTLRLEPPTPASPRPPRPTPRVLRRLVAPPR